MYLYELKSALTHRRSQLLGWPLEHLIGERERFEEDHGARLGLLDAPLVRRQMADELRIARREVIGLLVFRGEPPWPRYRDVVQVVVTGDRGDGLDQVTAALPFLAAVVAVLGHNDGRFELVDQVLYPRDHLARARDGLDRDVPADELAALQEHIAGPARGNRHGEDPKRCHGPCL